MAALKQASRVCVNSAFESEARLLSPRQLQSVIPLLPIRTNRDPVCRSFSYRLPAVRARTHRTGRRFRMSCLLAKHATVARSFL